jgi:hypothetical protein
MQRQYSSMFYHTSNSMGKDELQPTNIQISSQKTKTQRKRNPHGGQSRPMRKDLTFVKFLCQHSRSTGNACAHMLSSRGDEWRGYGVYGG